MTSPLHATTTSTGRTYKHPVTAEKAPSVTHVLKCLSKPALVPWASKLVAQYAVENIADWCQLGKPQATDLLKGEPNRVMRASGDLGSLVHGAVECRLKDRPVAPEVEVIAALHLAAFDQFLADWKPEHIAVEATVWSRKHGYAGTLDAIAIFDGERLGLPDPGPAVAIMDVKTGSGVYPEAGLQMAAYRHADFILGPDGGEVPLPDISCGLVLHLRPDGYKLVPVETGPEVFELFLKCLTLSTEWQDGLSKLVVGAPLVPVAVG